MTLNLSRIVLVALGMFLCGCSGIQSALDPAGEEASRIATLFWVMTIGGLIIWAFVVLLSLFASRWKRGPIQEAAASRLIFWGGVAFPVVVLTALLGYALWLMPSLRPFAPTERAGLRIEVVASQFWWRITYHLADGRMVVSANEVRLPVGERVEFVIASADMIHSFWIPALGGKMDAIPGRTNRLSLLATRPGTYRGQCAEFCGTSHAYMAFAAIAMEPAAFEAWLDERNTPSRGLDAGGEGKALFEREGCGACHRVDAIAIHAKGPDLSHVGSRLTIGAGMLDNDVETLSRFIRHAPSVKPFAQMPGYPNLSEAEALAIATWLKGLR